MPLRILAIATAALLPWAVAPLAARSDTAPNSVVDPVREALVAARLGEAEGIDAESAVVNDALRAIAEQIGAGRPTYRRARRLHRLLHGRYLLHYRDDADGLARLAERGEYNCVSATMFFGLAARELGYPVRVLELPGHLLLELEADGRWIRVETTSARGFDRASRVAVARAPESRASTYRLAPRHDRFGEDDGYRQVSLEKAVGVVWLNSAWRALERGETIRAATSAAEARRFLAGEPLDEDSQRVLSRAFRNEYERGDFSRAYRIATIEVRQFPGRTTARDRLFAAAMKRIEDECDRDDPSRAASIAEEVAELPEAGQDNVRFERRAWPVIAAAAVRLAAWDLASRAAERYARVEPDGVEARRVVDWVAARKRGDASVLGTCTSPEPPSEKASFPPSGDRSAGAPSPNRTGGGANSR